MRGVIAVNRSRLRLVGPLIEVLGLAIWVELALRRRPFDRVLSEVADPGMRVGAESEICHATFDRAIRAAYRILPLEPTCLKHVLIVCRVRRRRGLPAHIRIGVRKDEGVFAAHAWLEDEAGRPLTDPSNDFAPLVSVRHGGGRNL